ncbi:MAG: hypothetical protein O2856_04020 [Planctomycetota bacterium]|nr:hypothetical protein [Planctomycetota bacterium]
MTEQLPTDALDDAVVSRKKPSCVNCEITIGPSVVLRRVNKKGEQAIWVCQDFIDKLNLPFPPDDLLDALSG